MPSLSDALLQEAAQRLAHLTTLDLSGSSGFTMPAVARFSVLRDLDLAGCDGVLSFGASATQLGSLERLRLDCCGALATVNVRLNGLRHLSLRGCRALNTVRTGSEVAQDRS